MTAVDAERGCAGWHRRAADSGPGKTGRAEKDDEFAGRSQMRRQRKKFRFRASRISFNGASLQYAAVNTP